MPGGTWTPYTLTYTAIAADAGKYIGISFVTAKNSGKTSGTWAAYDDFSLTVVSIPFAPGGLTASAGNGQVILNWNPVANASGYYIKRSSVSGGSYTVIFTNLTITTFTNTGLANGTTNYYVVAAFNPAGAGANSTEVSAKLLTNMPPVISWVVPTNNSTFIQPKTITLTASATDADGTVTNVAFFNGTTLLGNVTSGAGNQFGLTWSNAAVGSYTLSARATDNSGTTNKSPATIAIVVQPLTLTASGTQTNGQFRLTFQGRKDYGVAPPVLLYSNPSSTVLRLETGRDPHLYPVSQGHVTLTGIVSYIVLYLIQPRAFACLYSEESCSGVTNTMLGSRCS